MVTSRTEYFLSRIRSVAEHKPNDQTPDGWLGEDLRDVVLETAEFLGPRLDVPKVEEELVRRSRVDVAAIGEVVGWLRDEAKVSAASFGLMFPSGEQLDWQTRLRRLESLVGSLEKAEKLDELEVLLQLGIVGDASLGSLLVALVPESHLRDRIRQKLSAKLATANDLTAVELWAHLRAEADPSRQTRIEVDASVISADFFDLGDVRTARERIARYLAHVRPVLERKMMERGATRFPAGNIGAATILSWTSSPSTRPWSTTDVVVIRSLGRLSACCSENNKEQLAAALGVQVGGYFIGGRAEIEARRSLARPSGQGQPPGLQRALRELEKLIHIAEQRSIDVEGQVEKALLQHKLGLEVVCQDLLGELKRKNELRLQRELCRYLIERGIPSYGTKFGRSEVDLRAGDKFGALVIEAKLVRKGETPSARTINRWLTQLGSYLDTEHSALRGALVVYNLSDTPIFAPKPPIRYRYLIIAVNLGAPAPSERKGSIEIEAVDDGPDLVRVIKIAAPIRRGRPKRSRRRRALG